MSHPTGHPSTAPPVVDFLAASYRAVRDVLTNAEPTGMRWRRPARECPGWCRQDHACSAQHGYPAGEHRSPSTLWTPAYGQLQATRVRTVDGRDRLELTAVAELHPNPRVALRQGIHLPVAVNLAVLTTLAEIELLTPIPVPAHRQVSGR